MRKPIYFDNHATTAVDPRVLEAMLPAFTEDYGNPGSGHPFGWTARLAVEKARAQVANLIAAQNPTKEIVFTAGATESIHLAILTFASHKVGTEPPHIITAATEHKATLEACSAAERLGAQITILPVDSFGRVTAEQVLEAVKPNTVLVTLMHGNNEVGTLHPIKEIGFALRKSDVDIHFHVDAAQTIGKHDIDVDEMCVDLLSLSAHKFHGPKGVGALYVRHSATRHVHLTPFFSGGGQERGLRSGTLNVPGIIGLGRACEIAREDLDEERARLTSLRDKIISAVKTGVPSAALNGHPSERLCNNINFTFKGLDADAFHASLNGFAFSSASACAGPTQSHVLKSIGRSSNDPNEATIRIGLSRFTNDEEVSSLIAALVPAVQNARTISGGYE